MDDSVPQQKLIRAFLESPSVSTTTVVLKLPLKTLNVSQVTNYTFQFSKRISINVYQGENAIHSSWSHSGFSCQPAPLMTLPRQCELVSPHAVDFPTDAALAIPRRLRKSPVLSAARHFSGAARPVDILSLKDSQILFGEGAILPKVSYSSRFEGIATFMRTTSKILEPIVTIVKWSDICCIIPSLGAVI